jgi:hypothetical protein
VSEQEFARFVDDTVTPLFPDGLTVIKAQGQFRGEDDVIVKRSRSFSFCCIPSNDIRRAAGTSISSEGNT